MNYGLYVSASGVLTQTYRQDVYANNLANVHTTGFKPDVAIVQGRPSESVEDESSDFDVSNKLLDQLGGGVIAGPQRIAFAPGAVEPTGNPLDAALRRDDAFFTVRSVDPAGQVETTLTRDGRFLRSKEGLLVTQAGHAVLNDSGRPISLPATGVAKLQRDGRVTVNGEERGRLGVVTVSDTAALEKRGGNLFGLKRPAKLTEVENPVLVTGAVEASSADPIATLMAMIGATKAATGNANMIRYHDTLMDRAINTLGRVA